MKRFSLIFAFMFLFSSCAPATVSVPPTKIPTTTTISTTTQTLTPSPTSTITPTPTPTLIPRMPITAASAEDMQLLYQISGLRGSDIAWSPDGSLLAIASNFKILLFDALSLENTLVMQTDYSNSFSYPQIMFSHDGMRILIAGWRNDTQGGGQIFDVSSGQEVFKFKTLDEVTDFCGDGKVLVSYEGRVTYPIFCLPPENAKSIYSNMLAFSLDHVYGATAAGYGMGLVQLEATGLARAVWYSQRSYPWGDYAISADFSPDSKTIAVSFSNGDLHFYDVKSGTEKYSLIPAASITAIDFSPDGAHLAYSSLSGTGIIDLQAEYSVAELRGTSPGSISDIEFSPDSRWLATANTADSLMLWEVDSGRLHDHWTANQNTRVFKTTGGSICQTWAAHFAFSPDGQYLVWTRNGTFQIIELNSRKVVFQHQIEEANSISFSPDGKLLATGTSYDVGGKDTLPQLAWTAIFDVVNGRLKHTLDGIAGASWNNIVFTDWHYNCVVDLAFTADNRTLAVADMGSIRFWDVQTGKQVWENFDAKMNEIQDIEISKDGSMLAVMNLAGTVKIWPFKDNKISPFPIQDWRNLVWGYLAFSPDGQMISFTSNKDRSITLDLWEITSNTKVFSETVKDQIGLSKHRLDFSDDGSLLAIGSEDGTISVYGLNP